MDDFTAGPSAGGGDDASGSWGGGAPPPVLLAAMGAALLIAVVLVAFLIGSGSGDDDGGTPVPAGAAEPDDPSSGDAPVAVAGERVLLTVSVEGGGSGKVLIEPRGATCSETCSHEFTSGTRVTVTGDPAEGSRFEGWEEACTGVDPCSFFMDRERELTATFEGTPTVPQCEDGDDNDGDNLTDENDPGCDADETEAPNDRPPPPSDCSDGRDNDSDGLVDEAQDPDCGDGDSESGAESATAPPPPPPPAATTTTAPSAVPGVSECRDGIDNDGDRRTDRPSDPGCDADGTEVGG